MAERHPQEVLIVVREKLVDLFVLVVALLLLLVDEHQNRERQADRRHDVAQELPRAQVHGPPAKRDGPSFAHSRSRGVSWRLRARLALSSGDVTWLMS